MEQLGRVAHPGVGGVPLQVGDGDGAERVQQPPAPHGGGLAGCCDGHQMDGGGRENGGADGRPHRTRKDVHEHPEVNGGPRRLVYRKTETLIKIEVVDGIPSKMLHQAR